MCAFFKEFYMLVAFHDSQALKSLLTQQQEPGAHLLKHTLRYFVGLKDRAWQIAFVFWFL